MEPIKRDGKIREQIEIEQSVRRQYAKKWGPIDNKYLNQFYKHEYMNNAIQKVTEKGNECNICPYQYKNDGDSYFVSKDMYNNLMAICRCGRPKIGIHLTKCLQKEQNKYVNEVEEQNLDVNKTTTESIFKIPSTSLAIYGWPQTNRYTKLEQSTKYISPIYNMPGGKIDGHPYSNIFIG